MPGVASRGSGLSRVLASCAGELDQATDRLDHGSAEGEPAKIKPDAQGRAQANERLSDSVPPIGVKRLPRSRAHAMANSEAMSAA